MKIFPFISLMSFGPTNYTTP